MLPGETREVILVLSNHGAAPVESLEVPAPYTRTVVDRGIVVLWRGACQAGISRKGDSNFHGARPVHQITHGARPVNESCWVEGVRV